MTPFPSWRSEEARNRNNQRLIAERTGWPKGALRACLDLERLHPGWHVSWRAENITPGLERPGGFYASHPAELHSLKKIEAYAPTAAELEPLLEEVPEHDHSTRGCDWCLARQWPDASR